MLPRYPAKPPPAYATGGNDAGIPTILPAFQGARAGMRELLRTPAATGVYGPATLPGDAATLIVYNPLSKPLFLTFDGRVPILPSAAVGATRTHDMAIPGEALVAFPLPIGATALTALIDNSAPAAGDTGYEAVLYVTDELLPPSTSPLA